MTLEQSLNMAMVNGRGEARRRLGLGYEKMAYKPQTIADAVDLTMNHEKYGITSKESNEFTKMMNDR